MEGTLLSFGDDVLSLVIEQLLPARNNKRDLGPVVPRSRPSTGDEYARIDAFVHRLRHLRRCKRVCKRLRDLVAGADLWRDMCGRQWPWLRPQDEETFCVTLRRCMPSAFVVPPNRGPHSVPGPEACGLVACVRQGYRCLAHGALSLENATLPRSGEDVTIGHTTSPANQSTIEFHCVGHDGIIAKDLEETVELLPLLDDDVSSLFCEVYSVEVDGTTRLISGGALSRGHVTKHTQSRGGVVRWYVACGRITPMMSCPLQCLWSMVVDIDVTLGEGTCVGTPSRIGLHVQELYISQIGMSRSLPWYTDEFWRKCEALVLERAREIADA